MVKELCVVEGMDWVGKSSVCSLLSCFFSEAGYNVMHANEPSSEPGLLLSIRELAIRNEMSNTTRALLMCASRSHLFEELAKTDADIFLLDRSFPSTYVYQGAECWPMLDAVHERIFNQFELNINSYLLTATWETALKRRVGQTLDVIESKFTEESYTRMTNEYRSTGKFVREIPTDNLQPIEVASIIYTDVLSKRGYNGG